MVDQRKFIVSHAPFWHSGSNIQERSYTTMIAALPAVIAGVVCYGVPALAVVSLSVSFAMIWEWAFNRTAKRPVSIADGNAALTGLVFAMLLPAAAPWWLVVIGTFVAIVIGKQIYGGIGANPFNPALVAMAILILSWKNHLNFDFALLNYDFNFAAVYPLAAAKNFGTAATVPFSSMNLLLGRQIGGIGSTFGIGLIAGGIYLMFRGFVRWEIALSFLAGVFLTAFIFHMVDTDRFAGPLFHLFAGYTLLGAFFLAPEDSSSPTQFYPMLLYGLGGGVLTVLIRNIGAFPDGVVFAVLIMNLLNPLLDKIRPRAIGRGV